MFCLGPRTKMGASAVHQEPGPMADHPASIDDLAQAQRAEPDPDPGILPPTYGSVTRSWRRTPADLQAAPERTAGLINAGRGVVIDADVASLLQRSAGKTGGPP
jgi:hypothetical protein